MAFVRGNGYHLRSELPKLEVQVLILWGRNDKLVDPELAKNYEASIKQCQVVWLDNCGHWPSVEQTAETARLLLAFVASGLRVAT